ncbi:hypothetical protein PLESTB_001080000 [Pleodorina starrii]|uniref:Uncharacterized protein n=1 Tax=Pleodorina starrii TaxID=330485 RepID=A0A9W6BQ21_9CHLO|nr:hypothetical protein PLESTB_001080000 [Pleodorina starrii]
MHFQSTDSRQSDEGKDDASLAGAVDLKALLRKGLDSDDSGGGPKPRGDAHSQGSPPMALVARSSRDLGTNPDDDAASDGGQSAMSAQSDDGADYKRGKRYRKLIKLMDSGQTQQTKRGGMVALGRSGQMQRYVHEVMTDVRSLDIIAMNKSIPTLYTREDTPFLLERISKAADEIQERMKGVLDAHHNPTSTIADLLFASKRQVWNGNADDGSDLYTNMTVWDFSTRFVSMARSVEQNLDQWMADNVRIANTPAGQFIIKSGPDLWGATRKIAQSVTRLASSHGSKHTLLLAGTRLHPRLQAVLDALLYIAVNNAIWVDTIQILFLATEGVAISCVAACYLAYLLRALAVQRYKLYNTFMVIPAGLTRTLASQNITLLDINDEDDDEEDDKHSVIVDDHEHDHDHDGDVVGPDSGSTATKQKRRATLSLDKDGGRVMRSSASVLMRGGRALTSGGGDDGGGGGMSSKSSGLESIRSGGSVSSRQRRSSELAALPTNRTSEDGAAAAAVSGMDWLMRHVRSLLRVAVLQRIRSVVSLTPFHSHATEFGNNWGTASKRKLKYDSHETVMVITPFAMWSVLVIVLYTVAVTRMKGIVEVVAVHSVSNFIAARTFRAVFLSQELAVLDDPSLLPSYRAAVGNVEKVVRDAWYTLLLGANAFRATGPDTERFPLVKNGLAYASPHLSHIFYGSGRCHRAGGHCPGPEFRYFKLIHSTLDGMMLEYLMNLKALASNTSSVLPGLSSPEFDFIYNIGSKDLLDGAAEIQDAHYTIIRGLFDSIFVLHIVMFILFWVIFGGFMVILLFPLLKRIARERRRVAELLSQLPLELDVERLVARALGVTFHHTSGASVGAAGAAGNAAAGASGAAAGVGAGPGGSTLLSSGRPVNGDSEGGVAPAGGEMDNVGKWKAIIRSAGQQARVAARRNSVTPLNPSSGVVAPLPVNRNKM